MKRPKAHARAVGPALVSVLGTPVATLTIDRNAGLVSVRPLRRRRVYTLTLEHVAAFICRTVMTAELREKRGARRPRRRRPIT